MKNALTALLTVMLTANAVFAADWTGFRGPRSSGVSSSKGVPTTWDDSKNLKWKLELPGKGYSSPIVVGDSVYVTCYSEGNVSELKRFLVRIHRVTGKVVWSKPFEPTSLTRVILGCQMPDADRAQLIKWCSEREHPVEIAQCVPRDREYGLRLETVSTD